MKLSLPGTLFTTENAYLADWRSKVKEVIQRDSLSQKDLATWLGLTPQDFSRKLSGKRAFGLFHFLRLSERLGVSTDLMQHEQSSLKFTPTRAGASTFDGLDYLRGIRDVTDAFVGNEAREKNRVDVSTTDIPIFWLLSCPVLAAFKLYVFQSRERLQGVFSLKAYSMQEAPWIEEATVLGDLYSTLASYEVWGAKPLDSLLQ